MRLVKRGKIEAVKGEESRSPYRITEVELEKLRDLESLRDIENSTNPQKEQEVISKITEPDYAQDGKCYENFIQIQKILVETMRDLASTQAQIALTLAELVKKV